ncbi:INCENP-ARK-bind domain-containing protein [Mycena chlorophos]|uniref:INCENP-ARK-bind domain-containing protein n=1 Tax=Mycena chlorophos TaxID=658473 RepID=A0A8H6W9P3_MYCCL|nr:INCENP-ARK-bind domain-containing protein [Mycena chlorophos]
MDAGLLRWCNDTRFAMVNDPGRQLFHDQVNEHGLAFLENYLATIRDGPRTDPLIELVKTPGRNKIPSKKPVASSGLKTTITYSLEDESLAKENAPPVNAFHQKLLQASQAPVAAKPASPEPELPALEPQAPEQNDLFVIKEDDENERTRASIVHEHNVTVASVVDHPLEPEVLEPAVPVAASSSSTSAFETTALSPTLPTPDPAPESLPHVDEDTEMEMPEPAAPDNTPAEPVHAINTTSNSASSDAPPSPKGLARKPSIPAFPSLPAPLPFRKSIKAPAEPSTAQLGSATPGGALAGAKRTSWLMKAREVKAREISIKKPTLAPVISSGSKRKSEVFATEESEEEERPPKSTKVSEDDIAPTQAKADPAPPPATVSEPMQEETDDGLLVQLKKTVDGLGARFGKSLGKSLGGPAAANALAEARAAAEARIAEKHREEDEATMALGEPVIAAPHEVASSPPQSHSRLSLSELTTASERKEKSPAPSVVEVPAVKPSTDTGTEPTVFHLGGPVFNKPVFAPPKPAATTSTFKMPTTNPFSRPAPVSVGLGTRLPSPKPTTTAALSAQSTLESVRSDAVFDSQDVPAWMPSTQETDYTSGFGSQSQCSPPRATGPEIDEDDSWPLQDRLAATSSWLANAKEDSMTWSTLPTSSTRRDTGAAPPLSESVAEDVDTGFLNDNSSHHEIPGSFAMDQVSDDEMELDPGKSTVSLVVPNAGRSQSQMSFASTNSSQSQVGFFGQATKLVSSMLGSSKKGKPEVKSLQLAAAAAKKEQEEKDKKANRLKDMENRRQAALQRKAEEEKAKAQEEERRLKEENERRKKERDEFTDKRLLVKSAVTKKIPVPAESKPELKKAPSKPNLTASTTTKMPVKAVPSKPFAPLASSTSYNPASTGKLPESSKAKGKAPVRAGDDDLAQPSQILQTQMAARAKAQLQAATPDPPPIASENIELPDINSEYSDSDDEDRPRTFNPPSWAQSPDLRQALEIQSTINPDDIFGAIRPLKMDELFRNRSGRFRARTSSANWTGTDRLTIEEQRAYIRRMGYK